MPNRPVIASYVSDFLKPDMLHVYRQITGLETLEPWVFTHKREGEQRFPFPKKRLTVLPKPRLRWWRRWLYKQVKNAPWHLYTWEVRHALLEMTRAEARLLHIYFGHTAVHFLPLIKAFPHPVVVSFHGADAGVDLEKPRHLAALQAVFAAADLLQARSESLAADLVALGCPESKIRIQRTGIPLEEWTFTPREAPVDGAWRLFQSCRLIEKKGLDLTLEAFAMARRTFPKATLKIAGDGPLREPLERQAAALGIAEAVTFAGFLDQAALRAEVREAHFFLHPSRTTGDGNREGVPNAMLEAMASGATVAATIHGGIPEAVVSGESGVLVPENDASALGAALVELMADPGKSGRYAAAARQQVEAIFDRRVNIAHLEATYRELMARGR
jgi:colanic acid/amylovoran biosynthesis glycosyltransferase